MTTEMMLLYEAYAKNLKGETDVQKWIRDAVTLFNGLLGLYCNLPILPSARWEPGTENFLDVRFRIEPEGIQLTRVEWGPEGAKAIDTEPVA